MSGARELLPMDFPGYAQAVARENFVRAAACLGMPERICGLDVLPMNIEHARLLALAKSPFLIRGVTLEQLVGVPGLRQGKPEIHLDVLTALWVLSPHWRPAGRARDRFLQSKPVLAIMRMPIDQPVKALLNYIDEAYLDAPAGEPEFKSYYAFEIPVAIEMARAFGLPVDFWNHHPIRDAVRWLTGKPSPLKIPLKILFQLRKAQRHMDHPEAIQHNSSDKLLADGLAAMNAAAQRQADYERELLAETPSGPTPCPRFDL